MATYVDLNGLRDTAQLADVRAKISVALMVKANALAKASPTAAQAAFAVAALRSPETYRETILSYILAEYNTATVATIQGATDAQVQTAVDAAVDTLLVI